MGGRASRSKGKRGEYLVRDYFRSLGYTSDRVPSSGAAQGFPGDIKVYDKEGKSFLVEVKSRQESFKTIYEMVDNYSRGLPFRINYRGKLISIAYEFPSVTLNNVHFFDVLPTYPGAKRTLDKIFKMQELLKGCEYLVVKDNNKPLLFMRYL